MTALADCNAVATKCHKAERNVAISGEPNVHNMAAEPVIRVGTLFVSPDSFLSLPVWD